MANTPRTLQEAIIHFSDADNCLTFLASLRWANGPVCPRCGSKNVGFIKSRSLWQCKDRSHPKAQFSIKVGTIFEDSAIGLDKWLTAMWMLANCKNGVSSHELGRSLGVTQKSAWFMLHRLRLALQDERRANCRGKLRPTSLSSAVKLATCTLPSARLASLDAACRQDHRHGHAGA